jgi:phage terminase small subunit
MKKLCDENEIDDWKSRLTSIKDSFDPPDWLDTCLTYTWKLKKTRDTVTDDELLKEIDKIVKTPKNGM